MFDHSDSMLLHSIDRKPCMIYCHNLYAIKRALYPINRALYHIKRALHSTPLDLASWNSMDRKPFILTNEPYISLKRPSILSKKPYILHSWFPSKKPEIVWPYIVYNLRLNGPTMYTIWGFIASNCTHCIALHCIALHSNRQLSLGGKPFWQSNDPYIPMNKPYFSFKTPYILCPNIHSFTTLSIDSRIDTIIGLFCKRAL